MIATATGQFLTIQDLLDAVPPVPTSRLERSTQEAIIALRTRAKLRIGTIAKILLRKGLRVSYHTVRYVVMNYETRTASASAPQRQNIPPAISSPRAIPDPHPAHVSPEPSPQIPSPLVSAPPFAGVDRTQSHVYPAPQKPTAKGILSPEAGRLLAEMMAREYAKYQ